MPRAGARKVRQYSLEFKLEAVKLSQLKGVQVQAVAEALEIHPMMLSRWRKEARDGVLRGRVSVLRLTAGLGDEGHGVGNNRRYNQIEMPATNSRDRMIEALRELPPDATVDDEANGCRMRRKGAT